MNINAELYKVYITEAPGWNCTAEDAYNSEVLEVKEYVLDRELLSMSIRNIQYKVVQTINIGIDITQQLIALAEKPIKLITETGTQYNTKCEVHMPGHGLSLYNEMRLLEDSCTDEIQSSLNSGWRIVAACPQPEQRRPDYILGRFNPDLENSGSAER